VTDEQPSQRRRYKATRDEVSTLEILQGAGTEDVDTFLSILRFYEYSANVTIVDHLEPSHDVHFLLRGSVRVNVYANSGRWVTYEVLGPGAMFGELAAIDQEPRSAAVATEEPSVIGIIPAKNFRLLITTNPYFIERALVHLARQSRTLMRRYYEYSALSVKGRVYSELLRLNNHEPERDLVISDKDMASRVGTTRENVTRIYSQLRGKDIISKSHSTIDLLDPEKLAEMLVISEFS
jgi:CRP/FNR family cyclic AMP-dependent transcriptional regulator